MEIGIIGTGAMASFFAAMLSRLAAVTMIGSWKRQIQAIQKHGLTMIHLNGAETVHAVAITNSASDVNEVDIALILVKTWQTAHAADIAEDILKSNGAAITLQNGIGNLEKIAAKVGEDRAILGSTSEGATILAPGIVRHAGKGLTQIAGSDHPLPTVHEFASLLADAGFDVQLVGDAASLVWGKLAINAGINPLTALLQVTNGYLALDPVARELMMRAAEETREVARVQGIELPYESAAERVLEVARRTAANRSSMAQDVARGTPTEIESITGAIVSIAEKYELKVPVNSALLTLMRAQLNEGDWRRVVEDLPEDLAAEFMYLVEVEAADEY